MGELTRLIRDKYWEIRTRWRYYKKLGYTLNLDNPKDLNEKIQWLKLRRDTSMWSRLADKYRVREYVKECGCEKNLVDLYGVWENPADINFDELPESFVLKPNHGYGGIFCVESKADVDERYIKKRLKRSLSKPYGHKTCEMHYFGIKPVVIAEQLLTVDEIDKDNSTSIIDYKIWCFNGEPRYIWTCCNRGKKSHEDLLYDASWSVVEDSLVVIKRNKIGKKMNKPALLGEMLDVAGKLAAPFPCVRVDLYVTHGNVYFGEMTFTSACGFMANYSREFLLKAGDEIDLLYNS